MRQASFLVLHHIGRRCGLPKHMTLVKIMEERSQLQVEDPCHDVKTATRWLTWEQCLCDLLPIGVGHLRDKERAGFEQGDRLEWVVYGSTGSNGKRATRLVESGKLRAAARIIGGESELAEINDAVVEALHAKHPSRPSRPLERPQAQPLPNWLRLTT